MDSMFATVEFCDTVTGEKRSLRVPVVPSTSTVRKLVKAALQRLVALLGPDQMSPEMKMELSVSQVFVEDPKFPDTPVELFVHDIVSQVVDLKEEVIHLRLLSSKGVLHSSAAPLAVLQVSGREEESNQSVSVRSSSQTAAPHHPPAPRRSSSPIPSAYPPLFTVMAPEDRTEAEWKPQEEPLAGTQPLTEVEREGCRPHDSTPTPRKRAAPRKSSAANPAAKRPLPECPSGASPFTPRSAAKASASEGRASGAGEKREREASRALELEEVCVDSAELEELPPPPVPRQRSNYQLRWGARAAEGFDPETYCDDPSKAVLPPSRLRSPIRARRQVELHWDIYSAWT